jgi:2-keto-4-pentenoate hydratase
MRQILDTLWALHQNPDLDPSLLLQAPEMSADEGQALQLQLLERWLDQGEELAGWKIGMTSGESRNALGDDTRPFGFVLRSRTLQSGAKIPRKQLFRGGVENELCFVMSQSLGQAATPQKAMQAIAGVAPAFEINQKRLPPGCSAGLRVSDNLSNWGIVVGSTVPLSQISAELSKLEVTLFADTGEGEKLIERVPSNGHIDDHFESLSILANRLHRFGHSLTPDQYIITGAYGKTPFAIGDFRGEFSLGIGGVSVAISPENPTY